MTERRVHTFRAMSSRLSRSGPPMLNTLCCRDALLLMTARTMAMISCALSASLVHQQESVVSHNFLQRMLHSSIT